MTDLEAFIELYSRFGISCIVNQEETGNQFIILSPKNEFCGFGKDDPTRSKKFEGDYGNYSQIVFDENGNFLNQGFWI